MKRPLHPDYDAAFKMLGDSLKLASEAHGSGTIGTVTANLLNAVIALDDCYAFDDMESPFTRARLVLKAPEE